MSPPHGRQIPRRLARTKEVTTPVINTDAGLANCRSSNACSCRAINADASPTGAVMENSTMMEPADRLNTFTREGSCNDSARAMSAMKVLNITLASSRESE